MADISSQIQTDFYPKAQPNALLDMANSAAQLRNTQMQNQLLGIKAGTDQLAQFEDQMSNLYGLYSSLAAKGDGLSLADIQGAGQVAISNGLATPSQVSSLLSSIPQNAAPAQLQQFVQDQAARSLDAHDRVATYIGSPASANIGGQTLFGRQNINGFIFGNSAQNTLSPSDKAAQTVAGVTKGGTPFNAPLGGVLANEGYDDAGNPIVPSNAGAGATSGGGAPNGPAANLRTSQQFDANAPVANPTGGVATSLSPGQQAANKASADQYASDQTDAANFQAKSLPLMRSYQALVRLGPEGTGPGKDQLNTIRTFLNAWGLPAGDVQNLQDFATAKKYLIANMLANGDTATNDKLAATSAANPSVDIDHAAAQDLVATAIAQQRIAAARERMAQAQGIDSTQYTNWVANQFNPNLDPRAYEFDLLSPKAKAGVVNGMTTDQLAAFQAKIAEAQQYGYVPQAPGAGNGQ